MWNVLVKPVILYAREMFGYRQKKNKQKFGNLREKICPAHV